MRRVLRPEHIAAAAGLIIAAALLFAGTFVGVADNGDFLRMMNTIGLNYYDAAESYADRFFGYSHSRFAYDDLFRGFYPSSQIFLVLIPRLIGGLVHNSFFDIRMLAAVYTVLLLAATWLLVRTYVRSLGGERNAEPGLDAASGRAGLAAGGMASGESRALRFGRRHTGSPGPASWIAGLVLAAALLFVFYDIGYLAYFNSLFGEPVSMVFMLLSFALGLSLIYRERPDSRGLALFFVAVLMLTASKIQNAPIGIAFALIFLRFSRLEGGERFRKLAVRFAVAIALVSVVLYIAAPKDLKHINLYQTVFYGILNESPDVKGDLEDLGLPERLSVLAGTNYFQTDTVIKQDDPSLAEDFYNRISHKDVLFFYLKHPGRLIGNMEYAASNSMAIRPYYLGNYEQAEGRPPGALSYTYSAWSQFKNGTLPHSLAFLGLFYLVYFGAALYEYVRSRSIRSRIAGELLMLLGLIGIFSFMVPILGDGRADMGKHLFLFNVAFDMMAVVMLAYAVKKVAGLAGRLLQGKRA